MSRLQLKVEARDPGVRVDAVLFEREDLVRVRVRVGVSVRVGVGVRVTRVLSIDVARESATYACPYSKQLARSTWLGLGLGILYG